MGHKQSKKFNCTICLRKYTYKKKDLFIENNIEYWKYIRKNKLCECFECYKIPPDEKCQKKKLYEVLETAKIIEEYENNTFRARQPYIYDTMYTAVIIPFA